MGRGFEEASCAARPDVTSPVPSTPRWSSVANQGPGSASSTLPATLRASRNPSPERHRRDAARDTPWSRTYPQGIDLGGCCRGGTIAGVARAQIGG